jgi:hypothetical protein
VIQSWVAAGLCIVGALAVFAISIWDSVRDLERRSTKRKKNEDRADPLSWWESADAVHRNRK